MSVYSSPSEPTRAATAASTVLLEDLVSDLVEGHLASDTVRNTADQAAEHVQRAKANGLACLGRIHRDVTWEDWKAVGAAMEIITTEAPVVVGAFKWDAGNKRAVSEFNARWDLYESCAGTNHKPLSKQERSALRTVISNPEISTWRATLTDPEKRKLTHPNAVLNRFKARVKAEAPPAEDRKPSPQAQMKATNIALQEELHRLKQHGGGCVFTKSDSAKDIATTIIGTFDGLANKTAKVEAVAPELNAWVKQQKMAAL